MAKREAVLGWKPDEKMPEFRQVIADGGIMWIEMGEADMVLGHKLEHIVIVSHRWSVYSFTRYARTYVLFAPFIPPIDLALACLRASCLVLTWPA